MMMLSDKSSPLPLTSLMPPRLKAGRCQFTEVKECKKTSSNKKISNEKIFLLWCLSYSWQSILLLIVKCIASLSDVDFITSIINMLIYNLNIRKGQTWFYHSSELLKCLFYLLYVNVKILLRLQLSYSNKN